MFVEFTMCTWSHFHGRCYEKLANGSQIVFDPHQQLSEHSQRSVFYHSAEWSAILINSVVVIFTKLCCSSAACLQPELKLVKGSACLEHEKYCLQLKHIMSKVPPVLSMKNIAGAFALRYSHPLNPQSLEPAIRPSCLRS